MTQRIDVRIDYDPPRNPTLLANQRSDSEALWTRLRRAANTASSVTISRHPGHPAPKPPPATVDPRGTFAGPGVWLSTEIRSLGWDPAEIAHRCQALGVTWVAIDVADNPTGNRNVASFKDVSAELAKVGVKLGMWADCPSSEFAADTIRQERSPFYIIDREVRAQAEPGFLTKLRAACPNTELAVVAGPFDAFPNQAAGDTLTDEDREWQQIAMLVEAYTGENPNATPAAQAFQAMQRGFHPVAVVVESNAEHGWTLDAIDEAEVLSVAGRGVSLYMLSTARDEDLAKFKRMAAAT